MRIRLEGDYKERLVLWRESGRYSSRERLSKVERGEEVYNIGGRYIRAGGVRGVVIRREKGEVIIKMRSGEKKIYMGSMRCNRGRVGLRSRSSSSSSAGRSRHKGRRRVVRGRAMNVSDHILGGNTRGGKRMRDR